MEIGRYCREAKIYCAVEFQMSGQRDQDWAGAILLSLERERANREARRVTTPYEAWLVSPCLDMLFFYHE